MLEDDKFLSFLRPYLTERRLDLIEEKLSNRTRYLTLVLEDIFNPHNANAVVRSCECFGVQDLHVIEERNTYDLSPNVLQGSYKWINLMRYNDPQQSNIQVCYEKLKKQGYKIIATSPNPDSTPIDQVDISQPIALAFGTELEGLSQWAIDHADDTAYIPMVGFTESFNISVGAALCMYELMKRIKASEIDWRVPAEELGKIRVDWYRNSVQRGEVLESEFKKREGKNT